MQKQKRRNLAPSEKQEWAAKLQFYFLDAFSQVSTLKCGDIAFHGGTSLRCAWKSPRFSEDLDFLISDGSIEKLERILARTVRLVKERFALEDPKASVEWKNKTGDGSRLLHFQLSMQREDIYGSAMVKIEFWQAQEEYLRAYGSKMVRARNPRDLFMQMTGMVPAADLSAAFCDKLVAFATRPHLKWRDIFDVWWLRCQNPDDPVSYLSGDPLRQGFLHQLSAYKTVDDLPPREALMRFLLRDVDETVALAEKDLRPFLPAALWESLYPDTVREMVMATRKELEDMVSLLEETAEIDQEGVCPMLA